MEGDLKALESLAMVGLVPKVIGILDAKNGRDSRLLSASKDTMSSGGDDSDAGVGRAWDELNHGPDVRFYIDSNIVTYAV